MAIKLTSKPNTEAVSVTYPYGNIKDDTGANDGTPVNKLVYADLHQFFERLMALAGYTHNGLPENAANGFQLLDALRKYIRDTEGSYTEKGTYEMADLTEITNIWTAVGANQTKVLNPPALFFTNAVMHTEQRLTTTVIPIGAWNMMATTVINKPHGLNFASIINITCSIINDNNNAMYNNFSIDELNISCNFSNIVVSRGSNNRFNTVSFDSTTINRGFITILHTT